MVIRAVIFIEQAQRRIPVQYAKRMIGRRMYGGTSTYIPLKVNQAGVIPVIFASSLLYLPQLLTQLDTDKGAVTTFVDKWITPQDSWVHIGLYFALIIFFTYFYVSITFNPTEVSDNMKKYGGFVPGIRPGRPTAEYLDYILSRITLPGSIYLGIIAVLPNLFIGLAGGSPAELPVRWHRRADHGRRGPGDGEADREPAHAAQLRGIPPVVRLVLVGPPGAGKGTQAEFIAAHLSVPKISTGDLFRANVGQGTPLGLEAKKYMDSGQLVPDEVTINMVKDRLAEPDATDGFLLDGFPRNVPQAKVLDDMLKDLGVAIDVVLELVVDGDEVVRRLSGRRTCRGCGKIWHIEFDPTALENVCDRCGGELFQRDDDKPETIQNRLRCVRRADRAAGRVLR